MTSIHSQLKQLIIADLEQAKLNSEEIDTLASRLIQTTSNWFHGFAAQQWVSDACSDSAMDIAAILAYESGTAFTIDGVVFKVENPKQSE